jgi:uncharacterized membrane protein
MLISVMKEEWYWIIVISVILILVLPLAIVWFLLKLPPELAFVATILLLIGWGVAAGYKDWLMARRAEEEKKKQK